MPESYDLLLKNGDIVDPSQGMRRRGDVAFRDGRVAAIEADVPVTAATEVIDVRGHLVTPGLLDIHGHFYYRGWPGAVDPDVACLPSGVTTAVDAGSTGWGNYAALRDYVMRDSQTRLYAFVHLCATGLTSLTARVGELQNLAFAQTDRAIRCIGDNPDQALGVKVRIDHRATGEANALPALRMAREVADATQSQMMVHVSGTPVPLVRLFDFMRAGDVATHILNGHAHNVLDGNGRIRDGVREARERGIVLDVGHAGVHFDLNVARAAVAQEFWPDTLSTDIHTPATRPGGLRSARRHVHVSGPGNAVGGGHCQRHQQGRRGHRQAGTGQPAGRQSRRRRGSGTPGRRIQLCGRGGQRGARRSTAACRADGQGRSPLARHGSLRTCPLNSLSLWERVG